MFRHAGVAISPLILKISPLPSPKRLRAGRSPLFGRRPIGPLARRVKGGEEGFGFRCLHNYGLTNKFRTWFGMTKRANPNRHVLNLGLMKIRLVSASGLLFFCFEQTPLSSPSTGRGFQMQS
jgi:hypothetical protein